MDAKKVLVIGAGVSGLSCAILLLQEGYDVTIWAKEFTPHTTASDVAAAFWYPYLCEPKLKAAKWGADTFTYLQLNVLDDPESGCEMRPVHALYDQAMGDPWWAEDKIPFKHVAKENLPESYVDGYEADTPLMDTSLYMPWLMKKMQALGGKTEQKIVTNFEECFVNFDVVMNCTGLGARELCSDERVYPVRGQVIRAARQGLTTVVSDDDGHNKLAYIIPRMNDVIIGGTAEPNNWNLEPDEATTDEIIRKAKLIYPAIKDVDILQIKVGLRPARDEVRLEAEVTPHGTVVHNYGHGGAGYTLSWGCALEVVELVKQAIAV